MHIFTAVWCIVWMFISFGMVRFTAYFAVCLSVLTGYIAGSAIYALWQRIEQQAEVKPRKKVRKAGAQSRRLPAGRLMMLIIVILGVAASMVPCASNAAGLARGKLSTPSDAWMEALAWLKEKTPEPFGSDDYYCRLYLAPAAGKAYDYPASAYAVAVWNDYGYWVTRIGHRIPVSTPGISGSPGEQIYFTAQDNATAASKMAGWGARYTIVDGRIASPNDKFYALASLTGRQETDFYELCWQKKEGKYVPLLVFYPEFYRTLVIRLYNFDGRQVLPQKTAVMTWQERTMPDGQKFKEILGLRNFRSYEEAAAFVAGQKEGNCRIVGNDPLASPVPLEALDGYKPVYQSKEAASAGSSPLPVIKIFEYNR